ncbi:MULTISPECIES: hypothetical protein [Flavobacteriaceae]|uniref:hypothetical protein n=1 Tax=Flavobacteriaceae TaxID=49546 RepID=UPI001491C1CD|nr:MULTISPECIES: hypothetical protein [Allomuricauda]MDC6367177.1 hypothetical protein [Muricauda sp. AC10]
MFTAKFKVVQTTGTFKNDKGEEKRSYQEVGVIFENENGHQSLKLTAYPLPNSKGEVWANLYPIESKENGQVEE